MLPYHGLKDLKQQKKKKKKNKKKNNNCNSNNNGNIRIMSDTCLPQRDLNLHVYPAQTLDRVSLSVDVELELLSPRSHVYYTFSRLAIHSDVI